jgi:hypothetical protein
MAEAQLEIQTVTTNEMPDPRRAINLVVNITGLATQDYKRPITDLVPPDAISSAIGRETVLDAVLPPDSIGRARSAFGTLAITSGPVKDRILEGVGDLIWFITVQTDSDGDEPLSLPTIEISTGFAFPGLAEFTGQTVIHVKKTSQRGDRKTVTFQVNVWHGKSENRIPVFEFTVRAKRSPVTAECSEQDRRPESLESELVTA